MRTAYLPSTGGGLRDANSLVPMPEHSDKAVVCGGSQMTALGRKRPLKVVSRSGETGVHHLPGADVYRGFQTPSSVNPRTAKSKARNARSFS